MKNIHLKIGLALFIGLVLTNFLSRSVFIANSPAINKAFISGLQMLPQNLFNSSTKQQAQPVAKKTVPSETPTSFSFENLPVSALKFLGKGIYAKEKNNNVVYIRVTKDVEFEEKDITYNGKVIKVMFPKGLIK